MDYRHTSAAVEGDSVACAEDGPTNNGVGFPIDVYAAKQVSERSGSCDVRSNEVALHQVRPVRPTRAPCDMDPIAAIAGDEIASPRYSATDGFGQQRIRVPV